jgi:hypothetical protein
LKKFTTKCNKLGVIKLCESKLIKLLDELVLDNKDDLTDLAFQQIDRLKNIILLSNSNSFVINGNEHAVYIDGFGHYDKSGHIYTLNIDELNLNTLFYWDNWFVPTIEGAWVDISLL